MAGFTTPGPLCVSGADPIDAGTSALVTHRAPRRVDELAPSPSVTESDGIDVVLTPIQLAAILAGETVEPGGSLSDRLWGGAAVVGGALELIGAGALLLTPEPTMVTKVAGGALGVHGLDTTAAGIRQVISGKPVTTLTADAAKAAAESLGVDERHAAMIGAGVDIAIPLIVGGIGAARVLAVRRGTISLAAHEQTALRAGGHTILEHVGLTEAQLRARLVKWPRMQTASTFRSINEAERVVSQALRANRAAIEAWAKTAKAGSNSPAFLLDAGRNVGWGVVRSTGAVQQATRALVVLRRVDEADRVYFILTAYPKF